MRYFPVFFDLQGQRVLVVGGGMVAERKIRLLLQAGARVTVVARELSENLQGYSETEAIILQGRSYREDLLEGNRLVFAATNDSDLNRRVYHDAEARGIPVNVVDDKEHCRFISPAIVDRSPVQVAISTGGDSPVLARRLRAWIELLLPRGLGRVAAVAGKMRPAVKRAMPEKARRLFWESQLTDRNLHRWSMTGEREIESQLAAGLLANPDQPAQGRVYLVGAGPGRPDLLTLRALNVLGQADVILHDNLVTDEILELARRDADRIYVGKKAGNHHRSQEEIHRIMIAEARKGRTVVRLKGGDAFVFGRGGEELEALLAAAIAYEVVPGITAAIGCAAYTGIPLTHRDHAQKLTFLTGHRASGLEGRVEETNWAAIAGAGKTAVVYMGLKQAESITAALLHSGISADLPLALVANGTRDSQQTLVGRVSQLPLLAGQLDTGGPCLLIIGQVAALGSQLAWFSEAGALRKECAVRKAA